MKAAIALGSSLGDRRGHVDLALRRLGARADVDVLRISRLYRTPPLRGGTARGWFLNAAALLDASLEPADLMAVCIGLEVAAGRRRGRHWGDRTLDIDLLLLGDRVISTPELTLPHPAIARRAFVLRPLLEVWPDAADPRSGRPWSAAPTPPLPRLVPVGVLARPPQRNTPHGPS